MRYLGNKESITDEIINLLNEKNLLDNNLTFFDAFCGTGSVADSVKDRFDEIIINDNLNWATLYTKGRLVAKSCTFDKLPFDPFEFLNSTEDIKMNFFYNNYSLANSERMYFTEFNSGRIDFFREKIQEWFYNKQIDELEYSYLLACLIESISKVSNTAGVYGAFLKHWDSRALKPIVFVKVGSKDEKAPSVEVYSSKIENIVEQVECDILYLDPPYTQNQYGTQYHLLETLVLNDSPSISKITGSRSTSPMRSDWSKNYKVHILFDEILFKTKAKYVVFSYSNNGIMSKDFIEASMKRYGKVETYLCKKISYKKYQNWKSKNANENFEYLFYIELKNKSEIRYESPLNYIGNKSKVINQLIEFAPTNCTKMIDAFGGGFNVGINFDELDIVYNDLNHFVKELIESFATYDTYQYLMYIQKMIKKFGLEKANKDAYNKAREYYNQSKPNQRDPRLLFTIILYGFNQQIRFNNNHEFNNPSGIRWFNDKILEKMISFSRAIKSKNVTFLSLDFIDLENQIDADTFLYLDPPYMLTNASYNDGRRGFNGWNNDLEEGLFNFIDTIDEQGVQFMLSYVLEHKEIRNEKLENWIDEHNYNLIQLGNVLGISGSRRKEILVTNYG